MNELIIRGGATILALALAGCSTESTDYRSGGMGNDNGGGAGAGGGLDSFGNQDGSPEGFTNGVSDGVPAGGSAGAEMVCDGMDDDGNGVIDDVDIGGDGICDCVKVATIGTIGPWGTGNVFVDWLQMRSTDGSVALGDQVLTPELLAPYDVIISLNVHTEPTGPAHAFAPTGGLPGVPTTPTVGVPGAGAGGPGTPNHAFSPDEVEALRGWVDAGGGLMTTAGYHWDQEIVNPNALLEPYGLSYVAGDVMSGGPGGSVPVDQWHGHPLSLGVKAVGFNQGKAVEGTGEAVASGEGKTIGMTTEYGAGKVFAWGDEWITHDRDWATLSNFQVELFWVNILGYLTPSDECQVPVPPELYDPE